MNAFADWLDNDPHFGFVLVSLSVCGFLLLWVFKRFKPKPPSFSSRGEEAGTPEPLDVNDEMAIADAVEKDDFGIWEAECAKLQRLADKLGSRS